MQVYIVGGAVRDKLLHRPIKDKDFVVVGATPSEMIKAGFIQVGADFPVFLHPITKAEYALARTERKSGKGYKGFAVFAAPEVTLEQDLKRRDLTINAMAIEVHGLFDDTPITGDVIDPYNGQIDIKHKVLRHVSEAFSEDPLRVLRVARFYGRFFDANADVNFSIATKTRHLISDIIASGELKQLTAERVWQETSRALMQNAPQAYFRCLIEVDALPQLMPMFAAAMQDQTVSELVFKALALAGQHRASLAQRWTIAMSCFAPSAMFSASTAIDNKPLVDLTQKDSSLSATNDLTDWEANIRDTGSLLKVPKKITQFAILYAKTCNYLNHFPNLSAAKMVEFIQMTKANKDISDINNIIATHNFIQSASQQLRIQHLVQVYNQINMTDIADNLQGSAIGEALNAARIEAIAAAL